MGDIGKGKQVTSYPTTLDTDTPLANCSGVPCVGGDSVVAEHINNPAGAIVAIETALGITPQGTAASVAARLAILLAADGGLPRGTTFPSAPVNVPQLFYRTDQSVIYYYNTSIGTWVQFLTSSALSAYIPIASPVIITAQHTFNPVNPQAPFLLGANALAQKVVGLKADTVAQNPDTTDAVSGVAGLNASSLVKEDPASKGLANGVASLDGSIHVVQDPAINVLFEVVNSGSQNLTSGVATKITLPTKTFDTNTNFDAVTNYRFTPTIAGKYLLKLNIFVTAAPFSGLSYIAIYKNSAVFRVMAISEDNPGLTADGSASLSIIADANGTTDYFEAFTAVTGTTPNIPTSFAGSPAAVFSGARVGR